MKIRPAILEDSRAIATIHVRSWQTAYRGIVPQAFLASLSIDQREDVWRRRLARGTSNTSVLEQQGQVLGWISVGPSRDPDAPSSTSELWAIYVAPEHWRRGIGQRLWSAAEDGLRHAGSSEATLWVLKDNIDALGFYRASGFVVDPGIEKAIELGGAELIEIRLRKRLGG